MSGELHPIEPAEVPFLERMGRVLRELRLDAGLSQERLAWAAELSPRQLGRLEAGQRRTRRSTLERIVGALGQVDEAMDVDGVIDDLVALAGPALAPPSKYEQRVARRAGRRSKRQDEIERRANELAERKVKEFMAQQPTLRLTSRERARLHRTPMFPKHGGGRRS